MGVLYTFVGVGPLANTKSVMYDHDMLQSVADCPDGHHLIVVTVHWSRTVEDDCPGGHHLIVVTVHWSKTVE